MGVFTSISFFPGKVSPKIFVYKTFRGPYAEVGHAFETLGKFMASHSFETSTSPMAGIYYDDPGTTNVPRSAIGFLINQDDTHSKELLEKVNEKDAKEFFILEIPETKTIVSTFPMRWTAPSCALSAMKTYPAFKATSFELKSGAMEIYRSDNKTVETHFPQGNFDKFNPQDSDSFPTYGTDAKKVQWFLSHEEKTRDPTTIRLESDTRYLYRKCL